jgi:pimeloyl-ACP methyl ester carboxylesterase
VLSLRALALLAALSGLLATASAAQALTFRTCGKPGIRCAVVTVPLDRTGGAPGTIGLHVERVAATARATKPPLLTLSGGPGDRATAVTLRYANRFAQARRDRDLIVFDQRGLGRSGPISCPEVDSGQRPDRALPACAEQLGGARHAYTSVDSAEDIEAIREALGVPTIALYGNSYGTWVAQVYARRHPDHVERLVFDSAIPPGELADTLDLRVYQRLPGLLRALCSGRSCRGLTTDLARDLYGLLDALDRKPLRARWYDADGKSRTVSLNRDGVLNALTDIDLRPNLRAEIPRAVAAARRGDPALLARFASPQSRGSAGPGASNLTINEITQCEERPFPWDRTASPVARLAQAQAAADALPDSAFAPVGRAMAMVTSLVPTCAHWPARPEPPDFGGPLPAVPALVLAGEADLRTPLESAQELRDLLPGSRLLVIPNDGHSSLQGDTTGCARRAAAVFLRGGVPAASCPARPDPYSPRALPPRSVDSAGGAARVARLTVQDALRECDAGIYNDDGHSRGGGLYGGSYSRSGGALVLRGYQFIRGVKVSGRLGADGRARLRVGRSTVTLRIDPRTVSERNDAKFKTPPVSTASLG